MRTPTTTRVRAILILVNLYNYLAGSVVELVGGVDFSLSMKLTLNFKTPRMFFNQFLPLACFFCSPAHALCFSFPTLLARSPVHSSSYKCFAFHLYFLLCTGLIGVTQPRRVAAVSMARRVAHELNVAGTSTVCHQIRYDSQADADTKVRPRWSGG
jgi:hypothetical protein